MENRIYKMLLILVLIIISCNNEDDINKNQTLNGKYIGTFTVEYSTGDIFTNPVTVNFSGENNYQSSGNSNYIPAGGSGMYEKTNTIIKFNDINFWTTNFDGNLILNGEYKYSIDGDNLMISANKNNVGIYKYDLKKQ